MNKASSFVGGWSAFFGCTLGGAAMGYYQWKGENAQRVKENVNLRADREETLRRIGEKARAERAASEVAAATTRAAAAPPSAVKNGADGSEAVAPKPPSASGCGDGDGCSA